MFHLTQNAYEDLKGIAIYTQENWGKSQRILYLKMINDIFHEISVNPNLCAKIDDIRARYFEYRIGSHFVFYRKVNDDVQIVRILHQRMDVESQI